MVSSAFVALARNPKPPGRDLDDARDVGALSVCTCVSHALAPFDPRLSISPCYHPLLCATTRKVRVRLARLCLSPLKTVFLNGF